MHLIKVRAVQNTSNSREILLSTEYQTKLSHFTRADLIETMFSVYTIALYGLCLN